MNFRLSLILLSALSLFWQCATPGVPPVTPPKTPVPTADDDHRSVSREEFRQGPWASLGAATGWKAEPAGVSLTLADGRVARLAFVSPSAVRWWIPAAAGEVAFSPAARYPAAPGVLVKVSEAGGILRIESPGLGLRVTLADLSWTLVRGDTVLLRTAGGPRVHGRRLVQAFNSADCAKWVGLGLSPADQSAKFWVDPAPDPDHTGPWAAPVLFGAGGPAPVVLALDNSYQTYTRTSPTEVFLGALNGGLDLLVATGPDADGALEALTALTGRPEAPPVWAHGTALDLPASESGAFVRQANLSIQTASGPERPDRVRFQVLGPDPSAVPGAGVILAADPPRRDWNATFADGGQPAPLARMNNRLPVLEAQTAAAAWQTRNTGLRPFLLARTGALGSIRYALPELAATAGNDDDLLPRALALGTLGFGTPAVHLDLTPLADEASRPAAYQSLLSWLFAPVLTLSWGPDPAAFWAALPASDQKRLKAILDRRSQFRPLLDQAARQGALTGTPAWKPLWFEAPDDPQSLACNDEFLWGPGLLAAPVTGPGATRTVYLPGPGVWFDFWTGEEFGGGRKYDVDVKPDKPLLFARGGAVVPVREPETFDDKDIYDPLTVHVFPGGRGSGTYYLDDGRTLGWKSGIAWETRLTFDFSNRDMSLDHEALRNPGGKSPDPYLLYRLHAVFKPKTVTINGKPIPLFGDSWGITDTDRSAAWYESDHTLLIKTFHPEDNQAIQMNF